MRKKLIALLTALLVGESAIIAYNIYSNKPAETQTIAPVTKHLEKEVEKKVYRFENLDVLKSELKQATKFIYNEETMTLKESYGFDNYNYITLQATYDVDHIVNLSNVEVLFNENTNTLTVNVPKEDIGLTSVELVSDIEQIEEYKTFGTKVKDIVLPWINKDEELKDETIKKLTALSREEAKKRTDENAFIEPLTNFIKAINPNDYELIINII